MKILCVGRNYVDHAKEMNSPVPEQPLLFIKPASSLAEQLEKMPIPTFTDNLHYEAEWVLRLGKDCINPDENNAYSFIDAMTVGIDLTARDIQSQLKKKGHPWEIAKSWDGAAIVGDFIPFSTPVTFDLSINNKIVQKGNSQDMIFSITDIIIYASQFFTLQKGDLIFTGTPEGVGPIHSGDVLEANLNGQQLLLASFQ